MAPPIADRERYALLYLAQLYLAATDVRDALRLTGESGLEARHRAEWPDLWERIDALCGQVTPSR